MVSECTGVEHDWPTARSSSGEGTRAVVVDKDVNNSRMWKMG